MEAHGTLFALTPDRNGTDSDSHSFERANLRRFRAQQKQDERKLKASYRAQRMEAKKQKELAEKIARRRIDRMIQNRHREEDLAEAQLQRAEARLILAKRRCIAEDTAEAQWRRRDARARRVVEKMKKDGELKYLAALRLQAHEFRLQKRVEEAKRRSKRAAESERRRIERLYALRARKKEDEAKRSTEDSALARARGHAMRRAMVRNARREADLEIANVAKREQRELERQLREEEAELQKLEDEHARFEQRVGRVEERFLEDAAIAAARSKHTHRISPAAMLSATVKEMARFHGKPKQVRKRLGSSVSPVHVATRRDSEDSVTKAVGSPLPQN